MTEHPMQLVSAPEMRRAHFEAGRTVRDAILQTPALMLPELAEAIGGLTSAQRCSARLVIERHLAQALESLNG